MIAVDTNVLIYAQREETPMHERAFSALRRLAEGRSAWALPLFCVGEFLRVVSHPRVFDPPTPVLEGLGAIESLLKSPSLRVLLPGPSYFELLRQTLSCGVAGNLVLDAQIAAVCLEHGARTLLTEDRDFSRFDGLEIVGLQGFQV